MGDNVYIELVFALKKTNPVEIKSIMAILAERWAFAVVCPDNGIVLASACNILPGKLF